MSAALQVVLAQPLGLDSCAAPAAPRRRGCRRARRRVSRDGCDVGCACRQWSSGHPSRGTLVRHFMFGVGLVSDALAPAPRSRGVLEAAAARSLVATGGLAPGDVVHLAPAGAVAIPVAAIAVAAQDDLGATPDAREQTRWTVQRHHPTEPVVLDESRPSAPHCCGTAFIGTVSGTARSSGFPAREGRCRAHLLQLGSGCTAPTVTPSRPAWPPCMAARQTPPSSINCSARHTQGRCSMNATDQIRVLAIT